MSNRVYQNFAKGMATLNTELTKAFERDQTVLYLLKRQPHSNLFAVVKQLNKGWFVKFNSFREQYLFRFATTDSDFESEFTEAGFIAYGVPDVNDKVEVYEIPDNQRDKIHPNGSSPFWQAFAVKMENERFGIFDRKEL